MRVRCVIVFWMAIQALSTTAQMALQPAGEGSAEAPYQISQLGHLVWMDETVSQSSNVHYRLMNDIDVAETVPVWRKKRSFAVSVMTSVLSSSWDISMVPGTRSGIFPCANGGIPVVFLGPSARAAWSRISP